MKQHAVSSRIILTSLRCEAAWRATSLATGERASPSSDHHFGSRDQIRDRLGVLSWRPLFSRGGSLRHGSSSTPEAGFRVAAAGSSRGLPSSVSPPFGLRGSSSLGIRVAVGAGCCSDRVGCGVLVGLDSRPLAPRSASAAEAPAGHDALAPSAGATNAAARAPQSLLPVSWASLEADDDIDDDDEIAPLTPLAARCSSGVSGVVPAAPDAAIEQPWGAAIARGMSRHPRRHARRLLAPSPSSEEPTASVSVAWRRSISSLTVMALLDAWHAAFRAIVNGSSPPSTLAFGFLCRLGDLPDSQAPRHYSRSTHGSLHLNRRTWAPVVAPPAAADPCKSAAADLRLLEPLLATQLDVLRSEMQTLTVSV